MEEHTEDWILGQAGEILRKIDTGRGLGIWNDGVANKVGGKNGRRW